MSAIAVVRWRRGMVGLLLLLAVGCAAGYSLQVGGTLRRMVRGDYAGALASLEKPDGKTNMVLYRLERGLIMHYQGGYELSNAEFERAEALIEDLYTRSASREAAALLTNDAIRPYRGEEFEQVLIHYYRALNYEYLGQPQEALVECRKANLKLEDHAAAAEYTLTYRNDAFMQYLTGLLYESEGELNDAYVSYQAAVKGYRALGELANVATPGALWGDLARVSERLGYGVEAATYRGQQAGPPVPGLESGEAIAFIETGFVGRKQQREIQLPILENDDTGQIWVASDRLAYRYRHPQAYHRASVKYWLRVALPEFQPVPSAVAGVRVRVPGGSADAVLVQDLTAVARQSFVDQEHTILARTAARALAKYLAARGVRKAFEDDGPGDDQLWEKGLGKLLGGMVNLFGAATEAADTRGWLALPGRIYMARLPLGAGVAQLEVDLLDAAGRSVQTVALPTVTVPRGGPVFVNYRAYL
jgi:uncharacterized protein